MDGWAGKFAGCPVSVSLSWPPPPRNRPKGCRITINSNGCGAVTLPAGRRGVSRRSDSARQRPARWLGLRHLGYYLFYDGFPKRIEPWRRQHEGAGAADHVLAVIVLKPARRIGVVGIPGERSFAQDD